MPKLTDWGPLASRLASTATGALTVAFAVLCVEAYWLRGAGLFWSECFTVSAPAAVVVALVGFAAGTLADVTARSRRWSSVLSGIGWLRVIRLGIVLAFTGYAAYGLSKAAYALLAATGTRSIAVAWLIVPATLGAIACAYFVELRLSRRVERAPKPHTLLLVLALFVVAWLASFFLLEQEVFEGISGPGWIPVVLAILASIASAAYLALPRRAVVAVPVFASLLFAASWLAPDASHPAVRVAIEERTHTTRLFSDLAEWTGTERTSESGSADGGSCYPSKLQAPVSAVGQVAKGAPDILLVTIDGVRWDHTTLGGYKRNTTPNLARWAEQGVVFERAYSNSASTRQTFRSLLSGLLPSQVAQSKAGTRWALSFPKGQFTLASYLAAAGYRTISIQSSPTVDDQNATELRGFEIRDFAPFHYKRERGYAANVQIDRVIAHLSDNVEKPRFVFAHIVETHPPFTPGPSSKNWGKTKRDRYHSAMHMVDRQLDRLIDFVMSPERRDDTVLVLAADHGVGLGDRGGMRQHGNSLHDDQTRVPLLVFGKDIVPTWIDDPVSMNDLFPTFIELAGLKPVEHVCGTSLAKVLHGKQEHEPRPVVVEIFPDHANPKFRIAYIENGYKLMLDPRAKTRLLYDLQQDPEEEEDVSQSSPQVLERMESSLREFLVQHNREPSQYDL